MTDQDAAEPASRATYFRQEHFVENSGHSVQSDQPRALIDLLSGILAAR